MNIQLIGISHKTAPVQIRALFAFTDENKKEQNFRLDDIYDIEKYKDQLIEVLKRYLSKDGIN